MSSNHLILCHRLLLLPSIFPSIRVFSNKSALYIWWPKYWSFSISPPNKNSGLISFKIDRCDLAVQGTLERLLRHHSSKALILQHSAFSMAQISLSYVTRKTIALTRHLFFGKVVSLLFNMQSRFSVAFLPRSKHLLISCTEILEPKEIKPATASIISPSIYNEVLGPDNTILVF